LQVLGRVYPKTKLRSTKVVPHFKEAVAQRPNNAELWELLGDLLSSLEPAGKLEVKLGLETIFSCPSNTMYENPSSTCNGPPLLL
jgi:hypothetical protein